MKPWEKDAKTECLGPCLLGGGGLRGLKRLFLSSGLECPKARVTLSGCLSLSLPPAVYLDSSLTACSGVESTAAPQKLLILDARSYTAAVANRAKGGGCECEGIGIT